MIAFAKGVAHTLDANHASYELVLDVADTLQDEGTLLSEDRDQFVALSTKWLHRRTEWLHQKLSILHLTIPTL